MVSDMLHKYEELTPGAIEQPKKNSDVTAGKKTAGILQATIWNWK